nr:hypothetical protein [Candidatus Sigynarchaeota archaeon]
MSEKGIDLERVAKEAFKQIFAGAKSVEIDGKTYPIEILKSSRLKSVTIGEYQVIEQNPKKESQWAQKASEGHKIAWMFQGRKYIARVMDGEFMLLGKKIVT